MDASSSLTVADAELAGPYGQVRVRTYIPTNVTAAGLIWAHGGGFAGGEIDMPEADWVSRQLAARGSCVVSVDYRLAPLPAHWRSPSEGEERDRMTAPIPSQEVGAAFEWAQRRGWSNRAWAIGGASAGANLAAGAALRLLREGKSAPRLVVLAYPTLHREQPEPDGPLQSTLDADQSERSFGFDSVYEMYDNYLGGKEQDLYSVPGIATVDELADFPPTLMVNSDVDRLRMSGERFAASLRAAGRSVDVWTESGTTHGHLNRPEERAARLTVDRISARLRNL